MNMPIMFIQLATSPFPLPPQSFPQQPLLPPTPLNSDGTHKLLLDSKRICCKTSFIIVPLSTQTR